MIFDWIRFECQQPIRTFVIHTLDFIENSFARIVSCRQCTNLNKWIRGTRCTGQISHKHDLKSFCIFSTKKIITVCIWLDFVISCVQVYYYFRLYFFLDKFNQYLLRNHEGCQIGRKISIKQSYFSLNFRLFFILIILYPNTFGEVFSYVLQKFRFLNSSLKKIWKKSEFKISTCSAFFNLCFSLKK